MDMQYAAKLLLVLLSGVQIPLGAEDIDVFSLPPGAVSVAPNVLFLVDDTAHGETSFASVRAALIDVLHGLPTNPDGTARLNVGIMLSSATDAAAGGSIEAAHVHAAVRPMDAAGKAEHAALIDGLDERGEPAEHGKAGLTMAAAYHYLSGGNPAYDAPRQTDCAKNFIIFIGNAALQDSDADTRTAAGLLDALGGSTTTIPISPDDSQSSVADEWARFMRQSPGQLTVHTLDIDRTASGSGPGRSALLKSMASVGGGRYFDVGPGVVQAIVDALNIALSDILAANSVFAPVSLPASTGTRGTFLNQVFIGMFRPDANALPRWSGNLKQYRLGIVDDEIGLLDADGVRAIDPGKGSIAACARSYWTPGTVDSYWVHQPQGDCTTVVNSQASNYPDGPLVEKGAQAYVLRSARTRTVKTCAPGFGSCTTLTDFDAANVAISKELLGEATMSDATRTGMIDWMRGLDVGAHPSDERVNGVTDTEMRASVHGDVLHSQPLAINYGTDADPQVVVFYAANDGLLRAINGNRSADLTAPLTTSTYAPGEEIWSFVAPESWPHIERLYMNSVRIGYPALAAGPSLPRPYAMDGPITVYRGDIDGTPRVFLYVGMRRGGRALYAFDVTTPDAPVLKWKRGCPEQGSDVDCTHDAVSGDWRGIGQTWSSAVPVKVAGYPKPVLLMGGGYDPCEDFDGGTDGATHDCSSTRGNRIYVIDADSGALLQTFITARAVSAALTPVSGTDDEGFLQFAYAADTGGNLYRISGASAQQAIGETAPGVWTLTRLASLGCDTVAACSQQRKFLFQPDVVRDGRGFWIMIGSGDREKPLESYAAAMQVRNHFFALRDEPTQVGWLADESAGDRCGAAMLCMASLVEAPADPAAHPDMRDSKGWYLPLALTESVVTSALTVSNRLVFSTFKPTRRDAGACASTFGESNVYNLRYESGAAFSAAEERQQAIAGAGIPPSPQAGKLILDDGSVVPFLIGGSPDSSLEASRPVPVASPGRPRTRVYWHIRK